MDGPGLNPSSQDPSHYQRLVSSTALANNQHSSNPNDLGPLHSSMQQQQQYPMQEQQPLDHRYTSSSTGAAPPLSVDHNLDSNAFGGPIHLGSANMTRSAHHHNQHTTITSPTRPIVLQTLTTLSTIVFTVIPVVIKAGPSPSWGHWYSWKDAVRFIEPFCSGLFHYWFFYSSDLMRRWPESSGSSQSGVGAATNYHRTGVVGMNPKSASYNRTGDDGGHDDAGDHAEGPMHVPDGYISQERPGCEQSFQDTHWFRTLLSAVFTFFLILYATGASIHTAAALFKGTIEFFLEEHSRGVGLSTHPLTAGSGDLSLALAQQLKEGYLLMQDEWEHLLSHYMYALGALGMSWCEMIAFSRQALPVGCTLVNVGQFYERSSPSSAGEGHSAKGRKSQGGWPLVILWVIAGVLYGGIVAGVACQYPKGLYVGLIYVPLLLIIVAGFLFYKRGLFTLGRYYILQTYVIGAIVALVAIIIYMAKNKFDMLTSNDKSKIGSYSRP